MRQSKIRPGIAPERMVVVILLFASLRGKSGVAHHSGRALWQLEMKLVGGLRTLIDGQMIALIIGNTGGVIAAYLGCVGEGLYQLLQDGKRDFVSIVEKSK